MLGGKVAAFVQQYGRTRHGRLDPNDRGYDRRVEQRVRRMDPVELGRLLGDDDDDGEEMQEK